VGIPARVIESEEAQRREAQAAKMGFSAYAVTQSADDPLVIALHRLIDHVAEQDQRIDALQQALSRLGGEVERTGASPLDVKTLNRMVD
jgi:serine O-acetyltransferase